MPSLSQKRAWHCVIERARCLVQTVAHLVVFGLPRIKSLQLRDEPLLFGQGLLFAPEDPARALLFDDEAVQFRKFFLQFSLFSFEVAPDLCRRNAVVLRLACERLQGPAYVLFADSKSRESPANLRFESFYPDALLRARTFLFRAMVIDIMQKLSCFHVGDL